MFHCPIAEALPHRGDENIREEDSAAAVRCYDLLRRFVLLHGTKEHEEYAAEEVLEQVVDEEAHGPQNERGDKQDAGDEEAGVEPRAAAADVVRRHG